MKFYIVHDAHGSTLGCETSLARARKLGHGEACEGYTVVRVECPVNSETVRRLLGNLGGYAIRSDTVYDSPRESAVDEVFDDGHGGVG